MDEYGPVLKTYGPRSQDFAPVRCLPLHLRHPRGASSLSSRSSLRPNDYVNLISMDLAIFLTVLSAVSVHAVYTPVREPPARTR